MNKFKNLVILEWHSITEPRADRDPQPGVAKGQPGRGGGSDRMQALNEPYHLSYESVESRIRSLRSRLCNRVAFESPTNPPIYSRLRSDRILEVKQQMASLLRQLSLGSDRTAPGSELNDDALGLSDGRWQGKSLANLLFPYSAACNSL